MKKQERLKVIIQKFYFLLRLPLILLLKYIFRAPKDTLKQIDKILLVRIDGLGDFVLSLPVVDNLRLKYPDARIDIIIRPALAKLGRSIKNISKVIEYNGNIFTLFREIRKQNYCLAIDMLCDYKLEPAIIALISRAPMRIGFQGGFRELLFSDFVRQSQCVFKNMAEINLELLSRLGAPSLFVMPKIEIENNPDCSKVNFAIHPGGHYNSQRWGEDNFALLARRILEKYKVNLLIIGSEKDRDSVNYIVNKVNNPKIKAAFPQIGELPNALSGCSLLICNNSGPLHLANALGIPTVSTMGPTDPILWWPQGDKNVVIRHDLACSPCNLGFCRKHECMNSITVEEMEKAVDRQVSGLLEK